MKTHFPEQITSWNHHRTAAVSEGPAAASADAQSRRMIPKRVASPCRCGWCSAHSRAPFPRAFRGGSKMRPPFYQVACLALKETLSYHPFPYTGTAAPLMAREASEARKRITSAMAEGLTHFV